jgi:hypothetical protein
VGAPVVRRGEAGARRLPLAPKDNGKLATTETTTTSHQDVFFLVARTRAQSHVGLPVV